MAGQLIFVFAAACGPLTVCVQTHGIHIHGMHLDKAGMHKPWDGASMHDGPKTSDITLRTVDCATRCTSISGGPTGHRVAHAVGWDAHAIV